MMRMGSQVAAVNLVDERQLRFVVDAVTPWSGEWLRQPMLHHLA